MTKTNEGTFQCRGSVISNSFLSAINAEVTARLESQKQQQTSSVDAAPTQEMSAISHYTSVANQYAGQVLARIQEFQLPKTADQLRTNLSDFYHSFDVNKYVDTQNLKDKASAFLYTARVSSLAMFGRVVSYSSSFLNKVQEIYVQIVDQFSNRSK